MDENNNITQSGGAYFAQDFYIKSLKLLLSNGVQVDLHKILLEMSYYEDIYSFVTSGHITVVDSQGFHEIFQLDGNQYIEMSFSKTPNGVNGINKTFRVYSSSGRNPTGNLNTEAYTLFFCSEELILSEQNKIGKSFKGKKITEIITYIVKDKLKVSTNKIKKIEDTTGIYDFIIPKMKPFEAISWLSNYARPVSKNTMSADMLFFETKEGFNFRSLASMFEEKVYAEYKYEAENVLDNTKIQRKTLNVLQYEISKPYDILNEINSGTFANRLISIDPLTRTTIVTDFNFGKYKEKSTKLNLNAPENTLKNRLNKTEEESPEGSLKLAFGNSNQQNVPYIKQQGNVAKDIFIESFVPNRTAQISLANYTTIKVVIPGDPGITAGRTIQFSLMSLQPSLNKKELDKYYSGKYLVTAARHIIAMGGAYQTVLELSKESSKSVHNAIKVNSPIWKEVVKK